MITLVGRSAGRVFPIAGDILIGRDEEANIQLFEEEISRKHAIIKTTPDSDDLVIEDLGSKNGTLVNGIQLSEQVLRFGDKIKLGNQLFMFAQHNLLEDQLMQAQRLESIGQLAGGMTRDFANILGACKACVGYMRRVDPTTPLHDPDVSNCIDELDAAISRAVKLSGQILGLARTETLNHQSVAMDDVATEVAQLIRRTVSQSIEIKTDIEAGIAVDGDPLQLNQMLMNLCINARDAMPDGGTMTISGRFTSFAPSSAGSSEAPAPGDHVELVVRDTGHGMNIMTLNQIFEPFFTTKDQDSGTGLGLPAVKQIVEQHGGNIGVVSDPDNGTTFTIHLPALRLVIPDRGETEWDRSPATGRISEGLILLVDDDEAFLRSTGRLLDKLGYMVETAVDGQEALEIFRELSNLVQLVMLDLDMPRMDGVDAFYALRKINPELKVLISTGHPDLSTIDQLITDGAIGYLQKPYDVGVLSKALTQALF